MLGSGRMIREALGKKERKWEEGEEEWVNERGEGVRIGKKRGRIDEEDGQEMVVGWTE